LPAAAPDQHHRSACSRAPGDVAHGEHRLDRLDPLGIAPIAGAPAEQMELRIQAADALLPLLFHRAGIPLAVLDERHFQQDLERMAREIPCPDAGA
jgi:hypothetical protein